jgi:hypothetical protein
VHNQVVIRNKFLILCVSFKKKRQIKSMLVFVVVRFSQKKQ